MIVDIVLGLLLVGYAVSGYRQGVVVGTLSLGGFLGGALLAMWLAPSLVEGLDAGPQRALVVLLSVVLTAWAGQFVGAVIGGRLREGVPHGPVAVADQVFGAVAGVVAVALVAWFVAGAVRGGPSPALSRQVATSRLLQVIDAYVPDGMAVLADRFRAVVDDTAFPRVFADVGPERIAPVRPPDPQIANSTAIRNARASVVKITGEAQSCSRAQEGSGVVVGPERVVTNAHVVAGVTRPQVRVGGVGRRYPATVVVFDPRRDLAVLAVPDLTAVELPVGDELGRGDDAVVAGFPLDGPYTLGAARVRQVLDANGEDIYGRPGAVREVYSLFATVQPGNSGGPVLSPRGELVGVVFAKSLDDVSTGYALTMKEVLPVIRAGVRATDRVSSGACSQG